jgi:hypothetical protein
MISPCSFAWSDSERDCGGLAAAELKKNEEDTEGRDDTEPEEGLSGGDGRALERGEEGTETPLFGGMGENSGR